MTSYESIRSQLYATINLIASENDVNGTIICVTAIDYNNISSSESCFNVLITESSLPLLASKRRSIDKSIIISESLPLCSASSFALIFVYYWVMFIGLHLLTLSFLVSYMLRNIHESYEAIIESYGQSTTATASTTVASTDRSINNDMDYHHNNADPIDQNQNYENKTGFRSDSFKSQSSMTQFQNGKSGLSQSNSNSMLYPLPKREYLQ